MMLIVSVGSVFSYTGTGTVSTLYADDVNVTNDLCIIGGVCLSGVSGSGDNWTTPVDANIVPDADDTYDLGSGAAQFRNAYIDGTLEADAITENGQALSSKYLSTTGGLPSGNYSFDSNTLKIDSTNNRVGIGVADPQTALHILGSQDIQGDSGILRILASPDAGDFNIFSTNSGTLAFYGTGAAELNVSIHDGSLLAGSIYESGQALGDKYILNGGTLTTSKWCVFDGTGIDCNVEPVVDTDTTIGNCSVTGSCVDILYETELDSFSELNSQILDATLLQSGGTLTSSKWCVYDGSGIDCNVEPVVDTDTTIGNCSVTGSCVDILYETELDKFSELNAQITDATLLQSGGDLISSKWCTFDGTGIDCNVEPVVDTDTTIGNCSVTGSCADIIYENELDSFSELNSQILDATLLQSGGTLTSSKWCVYDGSGIDCNVEPVVDTDTVIGNCSVAGSCTDILYETELDSFSELNNQILDATLLQSGGTLTTSKWCMYDGTGIDCNVDPVVEAGTAIGNCSETDSCADILYETELDSFSELNSQILDATLLQSGGTLTSSKWCVYDGTGIDCNVEPVVDTDTTIGNCSVTGSCADILYETELDSFSELNSQILDATLLQSGGTLTSSKWCVYDGSGIDCNVEPVVDTDTVIGNCSVNQSCDAVVYGGDGISMAGSNVITSADADTTHYLGRTAIGYDGSVANAVSFAHRSYLATYPAVTQLSSGATEFDADTSMTFLIGGTQKLVLNSANQLYPSTDDQVDLGTSENQFKDGFFDGNLEADAITENGQALSSKYLSTTGGTPSGNYSFDSDTLKIDSTNNRVGIGVSDPQTALHILGSQDIQGNSGTLRILASHDAGDYNMFTTTSGTLAFYGTGAAELNVSLHDGSLLANSIYESGQALEDKYVDASGDSMSGNLTMGTNCIVFSNGGSICQG